jgi:hypothetical protein
MNYKTSAFLKKKKNYKTSEKLVHSGFSGKLVFGLIKFDFFLKKSYNHANWAVNHLSLDHFFEFVFKILSGKSNSFHENCETVTKWYPRLYWFCNPWSADPLIHCG